MKISVRKLRLLGACKKQVDLFKETFGSKSFEITLALCVRHALKFNWNWAVEYLLSENQLNFYRELMEPHIRKDNKAFAKASRAYSKICEPSLRAWRRKSQNAYLTPAAYTAYFASDAYLASHKKANAFYESIYDWRVLVRAKARSFALALREPE